MELQAGPKILIYLGVAMIVAGVIWQFVMPYIPLGKLPGDIAYEKENVKIYFPIATSILLSVVLTLIMWLIRKF